MGTRTSNATARRNLITRTALVWKCINRSLTAGLKEIAEDWLQKFLHRAEKEIPSGYVSEIPELPKKFNQTLQEKLREALAQGYWLSHIYVQEVRANARGKSYHGKITLSDTPDDEAIRGSLQDFFHMEKSSSWDAVIPVESVKFLDGYIPKLAGNLRDDVLEKTRDVLRKSMLDGSSLQERMKALRDSSPELSRMTDRRIEAIARTEITRADTYGRLISMKRDEDVIGVEFSAILDDRTTDICESRNGLIMRLDDPRLPENTPPQHVNCRSLLLPLTVYDYPDGLLTSHEFDEAPISKQRPDDISTVRELLQLEPETVNERSETTAIIESMKNILDAGGLKDNPTEKESSQVYEAIKGLGKQLQELAAKFVNLSGQDREAALNAAEQMIFATFLDLFGPDVVNMLREMIEG
ncbi:MAG: minor capsid protein [Synergistaceae bacterium]|nr:minor capsid protein [Synergistaceae bacterium]